MAFQLLFDARYRVVLVRPGPDLTPAVLGDMRDAVGRFVAANGACRGIMDFTPVERIDLPSTTVVEYGRKAPALGEHKRVFVAPTDALFGLCRMFGAYRDRQGFAPEIVRSLPEAYAALGLSGPEFAPVGG